MHWSKRINALILLAAAVLLSACHTNLYTTPRTVPKGKVAHTVALEVAPLLPLPMLRYAVRGGLSDRVDFGFTVSSELKMDVKINAIRSRYFDLAVDPTIGFGAGDGASGHFGLPLVAGAVVPVLIGFNVSPRTTIMLQGGPAIAMVLNDRQDTRAVTAVVGLGSQFRLSEWLAIQPEVSAYFFEPTFPWPRAGIGFAFGPQPQYEK